ncbi:MAG TPA: hypothetical protein VK191_13775 [Symbiobacteriaceae bacterium]|nr:hypothetical protein [Symbiobacteriaceae bacterium]
MNVRRLVYWVANLWLVGGAAGVGLLPVLAPTFMAFILGGIFLVGGMLIAWIMIEALPGLNRLRIRFAFLLTAPVLAVLLLVRGDWFGAIWPGLLALGALLRSLELLVERSSPSRSRPLKPPFLGQ